MTAKRLYEGMFLVDSAQAAADWDGTLAVIDNVLKRADAEVVVMRKWGERKLAYDIDRKSRGTYVLCYFRADGRRIRGIEKDVQLSEKIMRVLILTTEGRPPELIERDITGLPAHETPVEPGEPRPRRRPVESEPAGEEESSEEEQESAEETEAETKAGAGEPEHHER
jgi:small subunit ribosomal protein S6